MNTQTVPINTLRIYYLETLCEVRKVTRVPGFLLPTLLFPWMFYVFFGLLFNRNGMGGQMPTYLLATYGTFGIIAPALFSFGVGVAIEKGQGWMDIKQASPMPPMAYIWARVVSALIFALAVIIGLFALGAIFGDVVLYTSQWLLLALVLVLCTLPFCAIGLAMGLYLKSEVAPAVVNLVYLPMSFLSGLWIPMDIFPSTLQKLALVLPPYHVAQLALKVVELDMGKSLLLHLGVLGLCTVVFMVLALRAYRTVRNS
jgi:ABC-2 type transport system permease protein